MKTFNEKQMSDPWAWCRDMLDKHRISSRMLSDALDAPRSTVRALYNGSHTSPRYDLLTSITKLCIQLENGELPFIRSARTVKTRKVAPKQPVNIEDFL